MDLLNTLLQKAAKNPGIAQAIRKQQLPDLQGLGLVRQENQPNTNNGKATSTIYRLSQIHHDHDVLINEHDLLSILDLAMLLTTLAPAQAGRHLFAYPALSMAPHFANGKQKEKPALENLAVALNQKGVPPAEIKELLNTHGLNSSQYAQDKLRALGHWQLPQVQSLYQDKVSKLQSQKEQHALLVFPQVEVSSLEALSQRTQKLVWALRFPERHQDLLLQLPDMRYFILVDMDFCELLNTQNSSTKLKFLYDYDMTFLAQYYQCVLDLEAYYQSTMRKKKGLPSISNVAKGPFAPEWFRLNLPPNGMHMHHWMLLCEEAFQNQQETLTYQGKQVSLYIDANTNDYRKYLVYASTPGLL